MKDIIKLDPPATIVVTGHSTLRGVSTGTLIVCATNAQGFLHNMLLPAVNVPGLDRHLFSGGAVALKGINTMIAKESYLDVGQFKIPLRKDTECPTLDYLNLELAPRGNYQTKQHSRRGSSRGTQYRRDRLWPLDFSGAGPWRRSPLL